MSSSQCDIQDGKSKKIIRHFHFHHRFFGNLLLLRISVYCHTKVTKNEDWTQGGGVRNFPQNLWGCQQISSRGAKILKRPQPLT